MTATAGSSDADVIGEIAGVARPEYGPRVYDVVCDACGATWCGEPAMACPWCVAAAGRQRADQRRLLLFPPSQRDDGPRYDELPDVDKRVWDATRGRVRGDGSARAWCEQLGRAVASGLITADEARAAVRRVKGVEDE